MREVDFAVEGLGHCQPRIEAELGGLWAVFQRLSAIAKVQQVLRDPQTVRSKPGCPDEHRHNKGAAKHQDALQTFHRIDHHGDKGRRDEAGDEGEGHRARQRHQAETHSKGQSPADAAEPLRT